MTTTIADPSSSSSQLSTILSTYKSLDLPSLQSHLTALTTPLTSLQTSSLQSRKKLAEETRAWKKLDTDQAKIDGVKPLLKLYQAEVDELTKRAREAEGGVQRVEERLRGVEDPYAVLERLIDQTASLADLESLRSQASQLRSDNASLQTQLTTQARADEERNRASSSRISQLESRLAETRSSVEAELRARYEERLDNAHAREEELRKQLEAMRTSHEAAQKKLASAASEDVAAAAAASSRSGSGGASAAEVEMLAADLQRAQQRVAAVERRNEQLREEVEKVKGGSNGGGGVDKEQVVELERRLADEQGARARLQAELDGSAEQRRTALAALEDSLAQSQKALKERNDEVTTLRSKLDSMADYGEVKRELEIMRIVEFSSGLEDDDDDNDGEVKTKAKPLEALLMEKNKKLQDDLATLRVKHHELEQATAGSTSDLGGLRSEVERLKALNERLEADLMAAVGGEGSSKGPASTPLARQAAKGKAAQSAEEALEEMGRIEKGEVDFKATAAQANGHGGASSAAAAAAPSSTSEASRSSPTLSKAAPSSSSSSDVLPIIVSQRDRFRARNAELEEELRRQFDVVTQLRSDIKGLQADNLALYEKVRYLQSYGGGGAGPSSSAVGVAAASRSDAAGAYPPSSSSSGRSRAQEHRGVPSTIASGSSLHPEDKYRRRYEASMNPFEAFRGREQRSALARLNPLERILHAFATMLVAHRRARIGAVIYAAGMHLLVFFVMVEYTFSAGGARGGGGLAGATCAMPVGGGGGGAAPMEPVGMGRP